MHLLLLIVGAVLCSTSIRAAKGLPEEAMGPAGPVESECVYPIECITIMTKDGERCIEFKDYRMNSHSCVDLCEKGSGFFHERYSISAVRDGGAYLIKIGDRDWWNERALCLNRYGEAVTVPYDRRHGHGYLCHWRFTRLGSGVEISSADNMQCLTLVGRHFAGRPCSYSAQQAFMMYPGPCFLEERDGCHKCGEGAQAPPPGERWGRGRGMYGKPSVYGGHEHLYDHGYVHDYDHGRGYGYGYLSANGY